MKIFIPQNSFSKPLQMDLPEKGVVGIFGETGVGKTTFLKFLTGLLKMEGAELIFQNQIWQRKNFFLPPWKRSLGYVSQDSQVFSQKTGQENLQFALRYRSSALKNSSNPLEKIVESAKDFRLESFLHLKPEKFSGGQRQRLALAQALIAEPKLILLDEPMSAQDIAEKERLSKLCKEKNQKMQSLIFYVTHSLDEFLQMADHGLWFVKNNPIDCFSGPLPALWPKMAQQLGVLAQFFITQVQQIQGSQAKVPLFGDDFWVYAPNAKVGKEIRVFIEAKKWWVGEKFFEGGSSGYFNAVKAEFTGWQRFKNELFSRWKAKENLWLIPMLEKKEQEKKLTLGEGYFCYCSKQVKVFV